VKSNSICIVCNERVRTALDLRGKLVVIDTEPHKDGTVWVDGYAKNGMVRVGIAHAPGGVPRSEPLAYRLHRHEANP